MQANKKTVQVGWPWLQRLLHTHDCAKARSNQVYIHASANMLYCRRLTVSDVLGHTKDQKQSMPRSPGHHHTK
jgi:hypothetical protein